MGFDWRHADGTAVEDRTRRAVLLPHEWVALAFILGGIYLLETLPVTYPRSALFLAYAVPVGLMVAVALLTSVVVSRGRQGKLRSRLLWTARSALLLILVMPVHFLLKSFIHLINRRVWDLQLLEIDRWFLFGRSPSIFFVELFNHALLLSVLDWIYSFLYYFVLFISVGVLLVVPHMRVRLTFVAAYSSMWITGMVLYLALPSWGPVFVWSEIFETCLVHMPRTVSVQSVLFEEISSLVRDPLAPRVVRFGCVAAFPSLHVAVVTLFTLASRHVSRRWFYGNALLTMLMLLGSVITGYHYLIDGLAGIVLTVILWFGWGALYGLRADEAGLREGRAEGNGAAPA